MRYDNFSAAYRGELRRLLDSSDTLTTSPRGERTRELLATRFEIAEPYYGGMYSRGHADLDLHCSGRKWSAGYFAGELCWYLSGSDLVAPISAYSKFWNGMSEDGLTVKSAYGARLFRGQFDALEGLLKSDAASRRAVITLLHHDDWIHGKDVPCTISLQFLLRENLLHLVATMRSNDVWLGTAYDVPAFLAFQSLLASRLGVAAGSYVHQAGSFHLYEKDAGRAEETISGGDGECRGWSEPRWDARNIDDLLFYEHCVRTDVALPGAGVRLSGFWADVAGVLTKHWAEKRAAR